jgi:predicted TIM-barrel fold metal-dependent hydrolase
MLYDVHCHFFTRSMLASRTLKLLTLLRIPSFIEKLNSNEILDSGLLNFASLGLQEDIESVFTNFRSDFGEDWAFVPLMLDTSFVDWKDPSLKKNGFFDKVYAQIETSLAKAGSSVLSTIKNKRLSHLVNEMLHWDQPALGGPKNDDPGSIIFGQKAFQHQVEELQGLQKKYPEYVFPFLGIDPRHDPLFLDSLLENGFQGCFAGIKLYTSLGFSPLHPYLVKTLYPFCIRKGIPITVHFSGNGFAALSDDIRVSGPIFDKDSGMVMEPAERYEDGVVHFEKNVFLHGSAAVRERMELFNHPMLWSAVLQRFPELKINFAHFGGGIQGGRYLERPGLGFWTKWVVETLHRYPNVYADISGIADLPNKEVSLPAWKAGVYDTLEDFARDRVLFGTDQYILSLKYPKVDRYIKDYQNVFKDEFYRIAQDNPVRFLGV